MFCHHCGSQIEDQAYVCIHCGVRVATSQDPVERALFPAEGHSWLVTLLLAVTVGPLGIHRFYVGKIATGLLLLFTAGGFCVIWIIDVIRIVLGGFRDKEGRPLVR